MLKTLRAGRAQFIERCTKCFRTKHNGRRPAFFLWNSNPHRANIVLWFQRDELCFVDRTAAHLISINIGKTIPGHFIQPVSDQRVAFSPGGGLIAALKMRCNQTEPGTKPKRLIGCSALLEMSNRCLSQAAIKGGKTRESVRAACFQALRAICDKILRDSQTVCGCCLFDRIAEPLLPGSDIFERAAM